MLGLVSSCSCSLSLARWEVEVVGLAAVWDVETIDLSAGRETTTTVFSVGWGAVGAVLATLVVLGVTSFKARG